MFKNNLIFQNVLLQRQNQGLRVFFQTFLEEAVFLLQSSIRGLDSILHDRVRAEEKTRAGSFFNE
ncbi:MAG: hypothetical protein CL925_16995 [Deltaproteobacteria bacterium]|nr:hypothetical protein [Deltaproteobacteria bacterium]